MILSIRRLGTGCRVVLWSRRRFLTRTNSETANITSELQKTGHSGIEGKDSIVKNNGDQRWKIGIKNGKGGEPSQHLTCSYKSYHFPL